MTYKGWYAIKQRNQTFSLKVFRHKERDTPDFSICLKPRAHPTQGHGEQAKVNRLLPRQNSTQLTFPKSPQILRARFRCMTSFTSPTFYLGFLFWHLWMTHPPRARVNTCAQVCTKLTHALSERLSAQLNPKARYIKRNPSAIILELVLLERLVLIIFCIKEMNVSGSWEIFVD